MARVISPKGRQVLEETIQPNSTSEIIHFYNPSGNGTVNELYAGSGYVQHSLADAPSSASDWHDWDEATSTAYAVSRIRATRGAVRFVCTSLTASFRISL